MDILEIGWTDLGVMWRPLKHKGSGNLDFLFSLVLMHLVLYSIF